MTLSRRLILAVAASVGVGITGVAVTMGLLARDALINQAETQAALVAGLIAGEANRAGAISGSVERLFAEHLQGQAVTVSHLVEAGPDDPTLARHLAEITADTRIDDIWLLDVDGGGRHLRAINGLTDRDDGDLAASGIDPRVLSALDSNGRFAIEFRATPGDGLEQPTHYVGVRSADGRALLLGSHAVANLALQDSVGLTAALQSLAGQPGVRAIWVVDDLLRVLGAVAAGQSVSDPVRAPLSAADKALAQAVLSAGTQSFLGGAALHVAAPILDRGGVATGAAVIHMPRDQLDRLLERYIAYGLVVAAVAFAVGSLIALFSARRITLPVMTLTEAAEAMERRSFNPAALDGAGHRRDELGTLIRVFQTMAEDVLAREEHLETLVRERTVDLEQKNEQLEQARQRMDDELHIAHSLQGAILPKTLPPSGAFSGDALMTPARELGGDFYDFFTLPDGRLGVVIADVSGKGVPAAFFMAIARTVMRSSALEYDDAGHCLREVNNAICEQNPHLLFVTLFYGILDPKTGSFVYANAGHNPPYLVRANGHVRTLPMTGGIVIGVQPDSDYDEGRLTLAPGDGLFLYTDGISEAMDGTGAVFGEERIATALSKTGQLPIDAMIASVTVVVDAFVGDAPQSDDITCIALRFDGARE